MKKTFVVRAMMCIVASFSLIMASSCVNDKYELSEENLDLNVNVFKDGLVLPLGNTEAITLKQIIETLGLQDELKQYLHAEEGTGAYSVYYASEEPLDLSEQLSSLSGMVDIGKIDFSRPINFSLEGVDVSQVSYGGKEIPASVTLDDKFNGFDLSGFSINYPFSIEAGLGDFAGQLDNLDWDLNLGGASVGGEQMDGEFVLASVPADFTIPSVLEGNVDFSLKDINSALVFAGKNPIALTTSTDEFGVTANLVHELPVPQITSVSKLHVKEGSSILVKVSIVNPFFTEGEITPHIDMNLSSLFHLTEDGDRVHDSQIHEDFKLTKENGWSNKTTVYIEEIVVDENSDWKHVVNAKGETVLQLNKKVDISMSADLDGVDNLRTEPSVFKSWLENDSNDHDGDGRKEVDVQVSIEFIDFELDDITMTFSPISIGEHNQSFDISIPEISLPKEVEIKSIDDLKFDDSSYLDLELSADLSSVNVGDVDSDGKTDGDVDFNLTQLEITFPERFEIEGADQTNTIVLTDVGNLAAGPVSRKIKVLAYDIADPVGGLVQEYVGQVQVKATGTVGGTVHTANLTDQIKIEGGVNAALIIEGYNVTLGEYVKDSEEDTDLFKKESIEISVPSALAQVKDVKVYLKDDPEIVIDIDMPSLSTPITPLQRPLKINVPEMICFDENSPDVKKYYADGVITLPQGEPFPSKLELPIAYISITPYEREGQYYIGGDFYVDGALGIEDNTLLNKADIDNLAAPGSKIGFTAIIPALEPDAVSMSYTQEIKNDFNFEPLKGVELPEMLKYVDRIELDEVYLSLALQTGEGFPDLGADAVLSMNAEVTLPEFIVLDDADPRYQDGKLTVRGELKNGVLAVEPVKIVSLDLGMTGQELAGLKGTIGINGSVSLAGSSLNIDDWVGKEHSVNVVADIKTIREGETGEEKLEIKKITGNVGYSIDPVNFKVDLSMLSDFLDGDNLSATIDLSSFYVALDIATNLGVPAKAEMCLTPYYDDVEGEIVRRNLELEAAPSADEPKITRFYVSNIAPENQDYTFVDVDIFSLLYKDESKTELLDSIKVSLTAKTDEDKSVVYEPSATYTLTVDYAAGLPLSFEKDFAIEYRDTIPDIPAEVISVLDYGGIGLGGTVENSLPFNLNLQVRMLDSQEMEVKMAEGAGIQKIKSCDMSGNPVVTPLNIILAKDKDADISDVTALELVFTADTKDTAGVPLQEDSYLKVVLNAIIPEGGITIDLKELMEQAANQESEDEEETNN